MSSEARLPLNCELGGDRMLCEWNRMSPRLYRGAVEIHRYRKNSEVRMKKKLLILAFIGIFSAVFLTGCATGNGSDGGVVFPPDEIETPDNPLSPVDPPLPEDPDSPDVPEVPDGGNTPDSPDVTYDILLESTSNGLNVRSGAGSGFASLGILDKGDMVAYRGESDEWYETVYKEKKAYVSKKYIKLAKFRKASAEIEAVVEEGKKLLGHPYVWGAQRYHWGNGKRNTDFVSGRFDCSSLMQYIYYRGANVLLELTTRTQAQQGETVAAIKRGDLLFFTNDSRVNKTGVERIGHVAMYLGEGMILHTASDHAVIEKISEKRKTYFITAKRFL